MWSLICTKLSLGRVNIAFRDMFFCDEKIISKSSFKGFSRFDSFDDTNGIYSDYPPYPGRKSNDLSFLRALQRFVENFNFLFFCQDPFGSTYRSRKDDFGVGKVFFPKLKFWLYVTNVCQLNIFHILPLECFVILWFLRFLSGSLFCTRLGLSPPPPCPPLTAKSEQFARSGG